MAQELQGNEDQAASGAPRGNILKNFGPAVGIAGGAWGVLSFFSDKPGATYQLLAQFGPRWVFFILLVYVLWDLLKRALHLLARYVENTGQLAINTGKVAAGIESFASKNDRNSEEMQRMMTYSVQTAQRSVEIVLENNVLLRQLLENKRAGDHA